MPCVYAAQTHTRTHRAEFWIFLFLFSMLGFYVNVCLKRRFSVLSQCVLNWMEFVEVVWRVGVYNYVIDMPLSIASRGRNA
jgi:hypothetical protein